MTTGFRHLLAAVWLALAMGCGCGSAGSTAANSDSAGGSGAAWSFTEVAGNWTVSFPRTEVTTSVASDGTIDRMVESVEIESRAVVSSASALLTEEDLADLQEKHAAVDLAQQASLELAPGCVGGGAALYTYEEDGSDANEFTITGGCNAELADTDANLGAFIDALHELANRYAL